MKQHKGFFVIGIMTVLLSILIMAGYSIYSRKTTESLHQLLPSSFSVTPTSSASSITLIGDKKIYKNNEIGISFSYPKALLLGEDSGDNDNPVKKIYIGDVSSQVVHQRTDGIYTPFTIAFWSIKALTDFDYKNTIKSPVRGVNNLKTSTYNSFTPKSRKVESLLINGKKATKYSGLYTDYLAMDNAYHSEIMIETTSGMYIISNNFSTKLITDEQMNEIISTIMFIK